MKKITAVLLAVLLVVSLAACGGANKSAMDSSSEVFISSGYGTSRDMQDENVATEDGMYSKSDSLAAADSEIYSDPDAKIIRSARMTIQTLDFDSSVAAMNALTEQYGGYYESAEIENGGYNNQYALRCAYYTVRIPKENYTAFRDAVGTVGYIYSAEQSSRNVGEEYYDTEARLETLTTKRERLLALLDKAELMEDIISLENALADVQYEIDMYTTTLRRYDSLIDYSTFTIVLNEVQRIDEVPGPQEGFGARILGSLKDGWAGFVKGLENLALWLARNIITLVILAVIVVAVIKIVRVARKKRRGRADGE